jgi:hypothetical protein
MWERASGVPSRGCARRHGVLKPTGRGPIRLGARWQSLLERAGQPQQRTRTWSWCVRGKRNRDAADVAVLGKDGVVDLVGSTATTRTALGTTVGGAAAADGLRLRRHRGRTYAFLAEAGRVRAIGVTTLRGRRAIGAAMNRVVAAKASNRPRRFVPAKAQAEGRLLGRALASSGNATIDARLALFCNLSAVAAS